MWALQLLIVEISNIFSMNFNITDTKYLAQLTCFKEMQLCIEKAEGVYLYDSNGKQYIDLLSGIAVNVLGHKHPAIVKAISEQAQKYLHLNVYGEFIQKETVMLARKLADLLPPHLSKSFFVNSGSEAIEGAIKLSKLFTKKHKIISFKGSYHGSTLSTLNLLGFEEFKRPFRPLIPFYESMEFNHLNSVDAIDENTACVVMELIQTASGMNIVNPDFLKAVRDKCSETGALLIFDEIQTSPGRLGFMFGFELFGISPDILCLAKGIGGGLPLGVFISSDKIMSSLENHHPLLGHATTFGGNPLCCSASLATLNTLQDSKLIAAVSQKHEIFCQNLKHKYIKNIHGKGLLLAVELESKELNKKFISKVIQAGIITNSFLFNENSFAIIPPVIINENEIILACYQVTKVLNQL